MASEENKEINAIIRMMIYLKHELIRNNLIEESKHIERALKSIEEKSDLIQENYESDIDGY
jgi:hypothetical protein